MQRLEVPVSGLFKLRLDHGDVPITLSIFSPDSKLLLSLTAASGEPLEIFFIAAIPGIYQVDAYEDATRRFGSCFGQASWLRSAKLEDKDLVEVSQRINEANNLAWTEAARELKQALTKYQSSLNLLKRHEGSREVIELQVRSLTGLGRTLNSLNQFSQALPHLQQAAALASSTSDAGAHAMALVELASCYLALGKALEAAEIMERALKLVQGSSDPYALARALQRCADYHYELNDYRLAQKYGSEALKLFERLRDRRGYTHSLLLLGLIASDLSNSESAASIYTQALSTSKAINYRGGVTDALTFSGHLAAKEGRLQEAVASYIEAEELARQLGDVLRESWVTSGLAYVYDQSGDSERALEYYKRTLKLRLLAQHKPGEASIYRRLGAAYFSLKDYRRAASFLNKAAQLYEGFKQWRYLAVTFRDLGSISEASGDYKNAADYYARSKLLMEKAEDPRSLAYLLLASGRLLERQETLGAAANGYTEALRLHRLVQDSRGVSEALFHLGALAARMKQPQEALKHFEEAIQNDESFRADIRSPELGASYLADVRTHYESFIDLLMQLHRTNTKAGLEVRALETSERARSRSLLDSLYDKHHLSSVSVHDDPELIARVDGLRKELSAKAAQRAELIRTGDATSVAALDEEINRVADSYERAQSVLRSRLANNLTSAAKVLTAKEIQDQLLGSNTVILEFALGNKRSYVWAITETSIDVYELPDRKTIEEAARNYYRALAEMASTSDGSTKESARRARAADEIVRYSLVLGRMLLGPVSHHLENKRAIIIADGALHLVPFGALVVSEASQQPVQQNPAATTPTAESKRDPSYKPLIITNEVVYLPSASILPLLRAPNPHGSSASKHLALMADPIFSADDPRVTQRTLARSRIKPSTIGTTYQALRDAGVVTNREAPARLVASRWEADAISSLAGTDVFKATDFKANLRTALNPELGEYRMIHFATHGILNTQRPSLSGILLSLVDETGQPQNGYLTAVDISEMSLKAELVTLSSCQTALGKEFNGEGMVGLSRAFMQAGAKRVVGSLWKVDDVATSELMKEFYRGMLNNKLSPAAALRDAQLKLREQKRWSSPYYWAGFVLQGEWN